MKYVYFLFIVAAATACASPPSDEATSDRAAAARAGGERCDTCRLGGHHEDDPNERVTIAAAPGALVLGDERAQHEIVVFTDLDCPYCRRLHGTLADVAGGRDGVRVVVRHAPLPMHGEEGKDAARAAIAATRLGKGAAFVDAYTRGKDGPDRLEIAARASGLAWEEVARLMRTREVEDALARDQAEARRLGVRGTPTFFVDGRRTTGARPREDILALVSSLPSAGSRR